MSDGLWPVTTIVDSTGVQYRIMSCQACGASLWCKFENGTLDHTPTDRHAAWHRGTRATAGEEVPATMLVPGQRYSVEFSCADGNFGGEIVDTLVSIGSWELVFEHATIGPADGVTIRAVTS